MDMAVGVIIGSAFGKIVGSLVTDVIMPPIGRLTGGVDFSSLYINLSGTAYTSLAEAQKAGAATINYGVFLNTIINFMIVAGAMFLALAQQNVATWPVHERFPLHGEMQRVTLQEGATVEEAIRASGLLELRTDIDLTKNKVGIYSRPAKLSDIVHDGDRVEIYRPLIADPKELRRQRAEKSANK